MQLLRQIRERSLWVSPVISCALFIIGTIIGAFLEEGWGSSVVRHNPATLLVIVVFLGVILVLLGELIRLQVRLEKKVGIKVRYVENAASGRVYIACSNVVRKAEQSIYIVNSYLVEGHDYAGNTRQKKERTAYYAALLDQARRGVEYTRILQIKPDNSPLNEIHEDVVHFEHLREMIKSKTKPGCRIKLLKAPPSRLTTFVLIDGVHLIWQINEIDGKGRLNLQGAFIIHDPQRRITEHFLQYFDKLKNDDDSVVIRQQDGKLS